VEATEGAAEEEEAAAVVAEETVVAVVHRWPAAEAADPQSAVEAGEEEAVAAAVPHPLRRQNPNHRPSAAADTGPIRRNKKWKSLNSTQWAARCS
jgi:hypothetical protein